MKFVVLLFTVHMPFQFMKNDEPKLLTSVICKPYSQIQ